VIPEVNKMLDTYRASREYVVQHRDSFERAGQAVLSKIMSNERAAQALKKDGVGGVSALASPNAPDLRKADTPAE
jgi:limonene 1,2-monooxygenase